VAHHPARRTVFALAAAGLGLLASTPAGSATARATDCAVEAQPPTLYAGMVFGSGRVVCSTPANKITITVVLEQDGTEVARGTRRDCQKTTLCWNTVGAVADDEPGDQSWCSRVWASASGTFLGEVRACEDAGF
jgi:hypothetical protein